MMRTIEKAVAPLKRRVYLMVGRAVLAAINDASSRQFAQIKALRGEVKDKVERIQDYGFTSVPLPGAQAVFLSIGGNRDHPLIIAADDPRYRKHGLQPGEVAIYTDEGDFIHLKRGNEIAILTKTCTINAETAVTVTAPSMTFSAGTKVRFETPTLECTGDIVDLAGAGGVTMNGMRDIYNTHTHPENDGGGPTDPPLQEMV